MKRNTLVISGAALLTAAALGLGGAALANAGQGASGSVAAGGYEMGGDRHGPGRHGGWFGAGAGQGVAGEEAVKVVEAAVAKEATAVLMRIGKASDGTYRVSMRRTDGTRIVLTLDASYRVTGTEERVRRQSKTSTPSSSTTT